MANSIAIGVGYQDQDIIGANIVSSNAVYAIERLGYTNGAYGTVTQSGNKGILKELELLNANSSGNL